MIKSSLKKSFNKTDLAVCLQIIVVTNRGQCYSYSR